MTEEQATRDTDEIPPALWCMLCLLRPYLEATGTIYRKYTTGPWRIRFELDTPDLGAQCFALTISDQEASVSAVDRQLESWRRHPNLDNSEWKRLIHKDWKRAKAVLPSILGKTWGERRRFSRMLDWAWEVDHLDSLIFVLERAGEIRGWR